MFIKIDLEPQSHYFDHLISLLRHQADLYQWCNYSHACQSEAEGDQSYLIGDLQKVVTRPRPFVPMQLRQTAGFNITIHGSYFTNVHFSQWLASYLQSILPNFQNKHTHYDRV
jgi:5-methylcytosine-specific restriction endonuclease McrBC regulatory subunit McrC